MFKGALNADYPQICIGVYNSKQLNSDVENEAINIDDQLKHTDEVNFHFQFVDFNDHGKLEHFVAKSANYDIYNTLKPLGHSKSSFNYSDRNRYNVVAIKQLDRDTIFIAFENQVNIF